MKHTNVPSLAVVAMMILALFGASALAQGQEPPKVQIPQPGVPQIMTMEGAYVRAAYNNEGYAILGYKASNESVGDPWLLLEIGITLRDNVKDFELKREALSLTTPDGKTVPLPSQSEYQKADVRALETRARVVRDSINYFPPKASRACRIGYFAEQGSRAMPYDQVELSNTRACLGRVYFPVEGGIAYGQYWLNIQFRDSVVRVPFRILTEEEQKMLSKNYKSIEKQVKEAFAPKKK